MRLDRNLYWILDSCITSPTPVGWLGAANIGELYNMPPHGLNHQELTDCLSGLFTMGYLTATWYDDPLSEQFLPTREQIAASLRSELKRPGLSGPTSFKDDIYYYVTTAGGEIWETYSNPDWDRCSYVADEEMICRSKAEIERYFAARFWESEPIIPDSLHWSEVIPWKATYWKTLPSAHRVSFRSEKSSEIHLPEEWPPELVKWLLTEPKWYTRWQG